MSSINLNGKRRRLEHASTTLSKPFKSPLRRPPPNTVKEEETASSGIDEKTPSSVTATVQTPTALPTSTTSLTTPPPSHRRRIPTQRLTPSMKPILADPDILNIQKKQRALQSRLATLRSELDTVQQALRIESSDRDEELEVLISKWKVVSQSAAEEVFIGAQDRVARMGGVKVWRERMKNDNSRWEQEEMESWFGNVDVEGADLDGGKVEARKAALLDDIGGSNGGVKEEEENEPEELTMDAVLKMLNIDLKTIGYDSLNQGWIKG